MGHNELWPVENRLRAMLYYSRRELPYSSCQPVLSWLVCDGVLVACVQAWSEVVLAGPLFRTVGEDLRNDLEDVLFKRVFLQRVFRTVCRDPYCAFVQAL